VFDLVCSNVVWSPAE